MRLGGSDRISFGPFCLSPSERLLTRDGIPVEIGGRSLDLLAALVEQPGRVLSKRDLLKRVWPDVVVEDGSLRFHMAGLRKILGDGENGARYIATQIGVGYAFVAPIERLSMADGHGPGETYEAADRDTAVPAPSGATARLPARPSRVIGREDDISLLSERIVDTRLFTIVGPAGVGKTTLAIEIGHGLLPRFSDTVAFVDLGPLQDPSLVGSAIAGALKIPVQGEDPVAVVLGHMRTKQLLLILDNCEHLIDAVSAIAERFGEGAPKVSILATSREPLRIRGEHVHWLGSLAYPGEAALPLDELLAYPAVELFVERASAADSTLRIDDEAGQLVAEMCRRLDGMALPIELAAVRVATHGLHATAQLLGERFSLAWTGHRTAQPRQQTLQATLDWSYDLLSEHERRTLERLSVFLGPFSVDAALEVVSDGHIDVATAAAALDELTAKSLVSRDRSCGASAYRLLEMTRAYARERLLARGSGEFTSVARRHAGFFLRALEAAAAPDYGMRDGAANLAPQLDNIRAALEWSFGADGDLSIGIPLAAASAPILLNLSLLVECRTWCARATAQLDGRFAGTSIELELQAALGLSLMFTRGNCEAAGTALARALDVANALDDCWNQLRLLARLHIYHERIGDFETAFEQAERAVEVANRIGEPEAIGVAASLAGISHHLAGDQISARRELELSLRTSRPSERSRTIHYGFDHRNRSAIALARTLWLQGYADQAHRLAEQTVENAARLEQPVTHCIALIWALAIYLWAGAYDKAQATLDTFASVAELNAFGPYIAASGGFRGKIAIQQGQCGDALGAVEESLARLRAARYELLTTSFAIALVQGLGLSGRCEEASQLLDATIDRCHGNGELIGMPELLRIRAMIARARGDAGQAEQLLQESLDWSRRQGARACELRAAIDLAKLRRKQGRVQEALAALKPLRETFNEGFDTSDLRAADTLLEKLSGLDAGVPASAPIAVLSGY